MYNILLYVIHYFELYNFKTRNKDYTHKTDSTNCFKNYFYFVLFNFNKLNRDSFWQDIDSTNIFQNYFYFVKNLFSLYYIILVKIHKGSKNFFKTSFTLYHKTLISVTNFLLLKIRFYNFFKLFFLSFI